jgi:hypothetical protein
MKSGTCGVTEDIGVSSNIAKLHNYRQSLNVSKMSFDFSKSTLYRLNRQIEIPKLGATHTDPGVSITHRRRRSCSVPRP